MSRLTGSRVAIAAGGAHSSRGTNETASAAPRRRPRRRRRVMCETPFGCITCAILELACDVYTSRPSSFGERREAREDERAAAHLDRRALPEPHEVRADADRAARHVRERERARVRAGVSKRSCRRRRFSTPMPCSAPTIASSTKRFSPVAASATMRAVHDARRGAACSASVRSST